MAYCLLLDAMHFSFLSRLIKYMYALNSDIILMLIFNTRLLFFLGSTLIG